MNIRSQYLLSVTAVLASVALFAAAQDEFDCAYLNEVCWKNTVVDDGIGNKDSDWVELYNPRSFSVNVGGYAIGKKGSWAESEADGKLFVLPSYTMAPGSYLLVFFNTDYVASELGLDAAKGIIRSNAFSLGTNSDETKQDGVRLFVPTEHTRVTNFKDVPILPENTSYGWVYDGAVDPSGNQNTTLATFTEPTPGASNRSKGTPTDPVVETGLVINEVCYANLTTPDGLGSTTSDFVELYNPGPGSVSLKGMKLGKKSTLEKCGAAVFELPDYTLESNEYFVVFFNKDVSPASTTVMRTVNGHEKSVPLVRSNALSFGTGTSTEVVGYEGQTVTVQDSVRLFDANGERIDNFKGEEVAEATGVRRNSSGFLEALLEDDTAVGYKVDGDGELAVIYTPTPWKSNTEGTVRPAEVVINEVCWSCLAPSEGLTNDFVELYNPGPQSVNIGGMKIGLKSTLEKCVEDGAYFTLPDYEMESNEFFVVYFTKNDTVINSTVKRMVNGREKTVPLIRTNVFSLGTDTSDEVPGYEGRNVKVQVSVRLFDKNGERVSNYKGEDLAGTLGVSTDKYGELRATLDDDQTFGYLWDGNLLPNGAKPTASQSGKFVLSKLTPWGPNADGFDLAAPVCTGSLPGRYAAKTACAFTAPEDGAIRYTTDGSDPRTSPTAVTCASGTAVSILPAAAATGSSGGELTNAWIRTSPVELATKEPNAEWREPIGSVSRARVVRAVVTFGPACGREYVGTWYIGPEFTEGTLPIVSVFADHDDLFSDEKGIYVPGDPYLTNGYGDNKWGKPNANYYGDGEVKAHVELVEPGATAEGLAIDAGLALNGGGTRSLPQKALYVKMKSAYGEKNFTYDLIPSVGERTYRRFLLRPDGNDWYGPYTDGVSTMMKDAVFHRIVGDLDMFTMAYRPAIVYLNGSYWGIHNIRESVDKQSFATRYGLNEDELDILTHEDAGSSDVAISVIDGSETAPAEYRSWLSSIQSHDVSSAVNYNQYVAAKMDVTNYIDYIIAECFFANTDWPINNCDFWRSSTDQTATAGKYGDRRWRWALYDLDLAGLVVDGAGGVNRNMLTYLTSGKMKDLDEPAFLFNQLLKNAAFKDAFVRRYTTLLNTTFRPERTSAIITAAADEIADEIETHYRRWGREFTQDDWRQAVTDALVEYTAQRWANSFNHLASQFPSQLGGAGDLTVKVGGYGRGGSFVVDGNPVELESGEWSGRYFEGLSVTVKAEPEDGYVFDGWEDDPTAGAERMVSVVSGSSLTLAARFVRDWSDADRTAEFAESELAVDENGTVTIVVHGGNPDRTSSVKVYLKYTGASSSDIDLKKTLVNGAAVNAKTFKFPVTLKWAAGEVGEKTITLKAKKDSTAEGPETFTLQLGGELGMALGEARTATITINDAGTSSLKASVKNPSKTKGVKKYAVTVASADEEKGVAVGTGSYYKGAKLTVKAQAKTGYAFAGWYDLATGKKLSTATSYAFTVAKTINLEARFSQRYYVRALADPADGATVTGGGWFAKGKTATLKAVAKSHFKFLGWYAAKADDPNSPDMTVKLSGSATYKPVVSGDLDVFACYRSEPRLEIFKTSGGSVTGANKYATGKTATLTAKVSKGYAFLGWFDDDGNRLSQSTSYKYVMGAENTLLHAEFKKEAELATPVLDWNAPTNLLAGVSYTAQPKVSGEAAVKIVSMSGLPAGLAYKSGKVSGAATTVKTNTVSVKVALNTNTKKVWTLKQRLVVEALPAWARGTYNGGAFSTPLQATVTVASSGKVSGKLNFANAVWTLSGTKYSMLDPEARTASLSLTAKKGTTKKTVKVSVGADELGGFAMSETAGFLFEARQNLWKSDPVWATCASNLVGQVCTNAADGTVFKFGANATMTSVLKSGKYSFTGSAVLCPSAIDAEGAEGAAFLYFAPDTKKKFKGAVKPVVFAEE